MSLRNRLVEPFEKIHYKKIQVIITFSFLTLTIGMVVLVSIMLYNKFSKSAEDNAYLNIGQIIDQVNTNLEFYVSGMKDIFEVVQDNIANSHDISGVQLHEQLSTILNTRKDLVSIALFTEDGQLVHNTPQISMRPNSMLTKQGWFENAKQHPGVLQFSAPHIENLFKQPYRWVVSMSKKIEYYEQGREQAGILMVDINFKTIDELSKRVSLGKKGYVYIIDGLGNIVYHPQQQLIYAGLKYENLESVLNYAYGTYVDESTGEERIITIKTVEPTGWRVVGVTYADETMTTRKDLGSFMIWFLLIVLIIVLIVSVFVSYKISKPLRVLERSVKKVEDGDFGAIIDVSGAYEVEQLSKRFNLMIRRIRELMDQIVKEQEGKRKGELEVLHAQINPHFLYNTLNSVTRLAEMGRKEEVVTTITSLSKFFRISLSKGKHVITLEDELEHVRNYLIIQKIRFKNKFRYEIDAQVEALSCMTLKLILQPLVENAIHHGIEMMVDEGFIGIYAWIEQDELFLRVTDNGLGMTEERVAKVLSNEGHLSGRGSGVGVRNVQERIGLYYGNAYGLTFESELEEGTTVTIRLPIIRAVDQGGDL
ncbi:two-component system sensor histidine kinase YesM [Paenibacillus shirakamiensis]|uniref:histidine kinase n=1 Tax=Paenibacillus shirakamiensis TaxID=1265935 RepID=A0ABS4JF72_9BACL|nr:sensor histidine kinase [Paenibacillus shirakamiensis]MBP1999616.1 two-component system sensor histidine kinase YesM [Paenibacillus shirakamiensis]